MTELLTEPRRRALLNVEEGNVYRRKSGLSRTTWMLNGSWQPPSQLPYNWLYEHDYIDLVDGRYAKLTSTGRLALDNLEGTR